MTLQIYFVPTSCNEAHTPFARVRRVILERKAGAGGYEVLYASLVLTIYQLLVPGRAIVHIISYLLHSTSNGSMSRQHMDAGKFVISPLSPSEALWLVQ